MTRQTEDPGLKRVLATVAPRGDAGKMIDTLIEVLPNSLVDVRTFVTAEAPTKPYAKLAAYVHQDDMAAFLEILRSGLPKTEKPVQTEEVDS